MNDEDWFGKDSRQPRIISEGNPCFFGYREIVNDPGGEIENVFTLFESAKGDMKLLKGYHKVFQTKSEVTKRIAEEIEKEISQDITIINDGPVFENITTGDDIPITKLDYIFFTPSFTR